MRRDGVCGGERSAEAAARRGSGDGYVGTAFRSAAAIGDSRPIGGDVYSVTIFANEMSRDGVNVDLDGMDFSNYEKNPVVLYAHDHLGRTESGGLPIGRTLRLARTRDGHIRSGLRVSGGGRVRGAGAERMEEGVSARSLYRMASDGDSAIRRRGEGGAFGTVGVVNRGCSGGPGRAARRVSASGQGDAGAAPGRDGCGRVGDIRPPRRVGRVEARCGRVGPGRNAEPAGGFQEENDESTRIA